MLVSQKSRTAARQYAKENNGKVVDMGSDNKDGRWFVEIVEAVAEVEEVKSNINDQLKNVFAEKAEQDIPGFRPVLSLAGTRHRVVGKKKAPQYLRQANGKQVEVIRRRSMNDYITE